MFEEFRPVSSSADIQWFHELIDESSIVEDGALGWFPACDGHPRRALLIPGPRRADTEY